ncbi:MAG TPA: FAD-binding oxidoreductase [Blastocatellia bacterium]|nr:FAD-binding oxidoreductase [Blastocatellia bacterium]
MIDNAELEVARSIESAIGSENVSEPGELSLDGLRPKLVARPGSADEVAACLKLCAEAGLAVVPAGNMTWLESGNLLRRADVVLSLTRMHRVIDYSPPDLTATVEAGVILHQFNALTSESRQWLPLDPPGLASATLGAIAACNSSGALRLGFGTPRDYVIGLKLAHADGTQSKSGGRVVKNVAGYDMNKLYVGSCGTLAVITELTFKLRPLPERDATLVITAKDRGPLFEFARRVLESELQPASVSLARRLIPDADDALLIRFIDSKAAVEYELERVKGAIDESLQATDLSDEDSEHVWRKLADLNQHTIGIKLSVPLTSVPAQFEKALLAHFDCVAGADIGTGIIRLAFDGNKGEVIDLIRSFRANTATVGGTLFIEKAPPEIRSEADAWGDVGAAASLMRSIKEKFDPQSVLNPGKFVAGI